MVIISHINDEISMRKAIPSYSTFHMVLSITLVYQLKIVHIPFCSLQGQVVEHHSLGDWSTVLIQSSFLSGH